MGVEGIINLISTNLSIAFPDLVLLITALSSMIFMAVNFKVSLVLMFMIFGLEYVGFSLLGWDTFNVMIALLVTLMLMALSLYSSRSDIV
jgi:hypothetical protein